MRVRPARRSRPSAGSRAARPLGASLLLHGAVLLGAAVVAVGGLAARETPTLQIDVAVRSARVEEPVEPESEDLAVARPRDPLPDLPAPDVFAAPLFVTADASRPPTNPTNPTTDDPLRADAAIPGRERRGAPVPVAVPAAATPPATAPPRPAARAPAPGAPPPAVLPFVAAAPLAGNRSPRYPRVAERRGWTGVVTLVVHVGRGGDVTGVDVVESSGRQVLDDAAVEAVREWRFRPATEGGHAVATRIRQPVRFTR